MNPELYFTPIIVPQETLVRQPKTKRQTTVMASREISLFKLTTSLGESLERPVRSSEHFSGVLVVQLDRPIQATQIVVTLAGNERRHTNPKAGGRVAKTDIFAPTELTVWKALRKGTGASTVLSDGVHVFNFSCQMPHLNYPQTIQQPMYDITYEISAKVYSPKVGGGGDFVAAHIEKDIFFTPLVTALPAQPTQIAETLFFEKKGKKGKAAVELRANLSTHQIIPGTKVMIDMAIKELSSASWTNIVVKLFERTRCRESVTSSFERPAWSVDRVLAQNSHVRSTVYSFFVNDEVMGDTGLNGPRSDSSSTQSVLLPIPMAMCGPLSTENLLFSHFIRVEIVVPSWMSSERFVYTDIPVQLLTYGLNNVARILHRRASTSSIDRRGTESDASSVVSGTSSHRASRQISRDSAEVHGMTLTPEGKAVVMSALPPRYCDVPLDQRTSPALINVNQAVTTPGTESGRESSAKQRQSRASRTSHVSHISHTSHVSQSTTAQRHPTISSAHGSDRRMTMSTTNIADYAGEEKYRTRQLPAPPPPPLPVAPMPTSAFVQTGSIPSPGVAQSPGMNGCHSRNTSISSQPNSPSQKRHDESTLTTSAMSPVDNLRNSDVTFVQQGFKHMSLSASIRSTGSVYRSDTLSGGTAGQPRTPLSPVYNDNISPDAGSDDDAGYFKSSAMKNAAESERPFEKGSLFRLRKNSSIKQLRKEPDFQMQYPLP